MEAIATTGNNKLSLQLLPYAFSLTPGVGISISAAKKNFKPQNWVLRSSRISGWGSTSIRCSSSSARERRRLRNERRQHKAACLEEAVAQRMREKVDMSKLSTWERLHLHGQQWWTLYVSSNNRVKSVSHHISKHFPSRFPDVPFQIFVPEVPARRKLKDRSFSRAKKKLYPGCIFVKCPMNKEIHDFLKGVPNVRAFEGRELGNPMLGISIIEPTPVGKSRMELLMKKVKEEEEAFEREILESKKLLIEQAQCNSKNAPKATTRRHKKPVSVEKDERASAISERLQKLSPSKERKPEENFKKEALLKRRTSTDDLKEPNSEPFSNLISILQDMDGYKKVVAEEDVS